MTNAKGIRVSNEVIPTNHSRQMIFTCDGRVTAPYPCQGGSLRSMGMSDRVIAPNTPKTYRVGSADRRVHDWQPCQLIAPYKECL